LKKTLFSWLISLGIAVCVGIGVTVVGGETYNTVYEDTTPNTAASSYESPTPTPRHIFDYKPWKP